MEIPARMTTRGRMCPAFQIDECFAEEVQKRKWSYTTKGYFQGWLDRKVVRLHRFIWKLHTGEWPKQQIDHINRDPLDNRIANLRDVSQSENMKNQTPLCKLGKKRSKKSGLPTGVGFDSRRRSRPYQAKIQVGVRNKHLGLFATPEEASARYQREVESMKAALSQT